MACDNGNLIRTILMYIINLSLNEHVYSTRFLHEHLNQSVPYLSHAIYQKFFSQSDLDQIFLYRCGCKSPRP